MATGTSLARLPGTQLASIHPWMEQLQCPGGQGRLLSCYATGMLDRAPTPFNSLREAPQPGNGHLTGPGRVRVAPPGPGARCCSH